MEGDAIKIETPAVSSWGLRRGLFIAQSVGGDGGLRDDIGKQRAALP
jgi:hypothetical protein